MLDRVPGGLNIKILHIVPPKKFLNHVVDFSVALNRGDNVYACIAASSEISCAEVSCDPDIGTGFGATAFQEPEDMNAQAGAIFVHTLWEHMCDRLGNARPETALVWCGMGADYIRFAPAFRGRLLLSATKWQATLGKWNSHLSAAAHHKTMRCHGISWLSQ